MPYLNTYYISALQNSMGQKKKNKQLAPNVQYGSGLVEEMGRIYPIIPPFLDMEFPMQGHMFRGDTFWSPVRLVVLSCTALARCLLFSL